MSQATPSGDAALLLLPSLAERAGGADTVYAGGVHVGRTEQNISPLTSGHFCWG